MPRYRFGEFQFNSKNGTLISGSDTSRDPVRLAPMPAKLLELLLQNAGEIVLRREIENHLWSDGVVEFQPSVHSYIRQIRVALDDSASNPLYIKTIHRRGYEFIPSVSTLDDETFYTSTNEHFAASTSSEGRPRRAISRGVSLPVVAIVFLALLATILWLAPLQQETSLRVAVTSFQPTTVPSEQNGGVAEQIVDQLANQNVIPVDVIGPTTTQQFEGMPNRLPQMADEYNIDYIINGRFSTEDQQTEILAEVIRASDGVHVWTGHIESAVSDSLSAARIVEGFLNSQIKD